MRLTCGWACVVWLAVSLAPGNGVIEFLSHLQHIAKLPQLDHLAKLPQLDHLAKLPQLDHLTKLPQLDHLAKLPQLDRLAKLTQLEKLTKLPQLEHIAKLSRELRGGQERKGYNTQVLNEDLLNLYPVFVCKEF
jgi:hypothetical protein